MNKVVIKKIDNNKFRVSLEVPLEDKWYDDVFFNCFNSNNHYSFKLNHKENKEGSIIFENDIELPDSALYNTFINCKVDGEDFYLDKDNNLKKSIDKIDMKKISVNFNVPDWCKNAMIYHIFVDRFYRSDTDKLIPKSRKSIHIDLTEEPLIGPDSNGIWTNDFYGGDLKGITEKLDYIKSLGVSIIYLSPIVESQSNHRYDTADYLKVDPYAGSMEDLKLLCDKAHELGIKIILDAVFNHTGNDSIYFNEYNSYDSIGAFHNRDSYYSKFYQKENNNFKYWWGFKNLPECDCNSKEWQEFICGNNGVIDNWFKMGIDGLRLDVADELSDHFIKLIRKACNRNKSDSFIYGEVWEQPIYKNRNYIMSGHAMHSIMNYRGMDALIRYYNYADIDKLNNVISMILSEYPKETRDSLMNSLSTHDISRIITILGCPNLFNQNSRWAWDLNSYIDNEFIKNQLHRLIKYVPYRFLSPWFKAFCSDEEYIALSKQYKNNCLYALMTETNNPFIIINPSWEKYLRENCDELIDFSFNELFHFLQDKNPYITDLRKKIDTRTYDDVSSVYNKAIEPNVINEIIIKNEGRFCSLCDKDGDTLYSSSGKIIKLKSSYYRLTYTYSSFYVNLIVQNVYGSFHTGERIINAQYKSDLHDKLNKDIYHEQIEAIKCDDKNNCYYIQIDDIWYNNSGDYVDSEDRKANRKKRLELRTPKEVETEEKPVVKKDLSIVAYNAGTIAVVGNTKPYKEDLKSMGGYYVSSTSWGPAWVFREKKRNALQAYIREHADLNLKGVS